MGNIEKKLLAEQLALWVDKLRSISDLGLMHSKNIYEQEHYQAMQEIVIEMLVVTTDIPPEEIETLSLQHLFDPTPLSVADAAVLNEEGRILLIQRADNKMWAMPGGMLEVGETPAEGAIRETLEETGVHCFAKELVGVFDSRYTGGKSSFHLYHFTFLCELDTSKEIEEAAFAHETLGFGWFAEAKLPKKIDAGHITRIPKVFDMWRDRQTNSKSTVQSYFDSKS